MAKYSKFIAAALAFLGVVVASGLLHGQAQAWASCILTAIGAALVYLVPNMPRPPKRDQRGASDVYVLIVVVLLLLIFLAVVGVL
jgi:hypothetical protein